MDLISTILVIVRVIGLGLVAILAFYAARALAVFNYFDVGQALYGLIYIYIKYNTYYA